MNSTLLGKELRGLRFCTLLVLVLNGILWITNLYQEFPDRFAESVIMDGEDWLHSWLLVGLFVGITCFNQEREHGTLGFLDGLAVARRTIFLHKLLAALLVLILVPALAFVSVMIREGLSATSVSAPIPVNRYLAECCLGLLLGITVTATGMVLSFTRKWFPLAAGLLFYGLILAATSTRQWVSWIDSDALVTLHPGQDGTWAVPWKQITGFSFFAAAMLLLAGVLFHWRDGRVSRWLERDYALWQKTILGVLATAAWGAGIYFYVKSQSSTRTWEAEVTAKAGSVPPGSRDGRIGGFGFAKTRRYDVLFKDFQLKEVKERINGIDKIYQQVADYFQRPPLPQGRIVLDLASSVDSHAAGVTNWTKIRVPISKSEGGLDFTQVLRHETAHVLINQLSDGKALAYFDRMRAYHEGVATAVEVSPDDEAGRNARLKMDRWIALADSRGRVPLDTLLDNELLIARSDASLVYPLGYVFAKALVEVGGPGMPRRILETLRDSPPPSGLNSRQLWEYLLHECGTSLEAVTAAYTTGLNRISAQEAKYVAGFPRLSAEVTVEGAEIIIRLNPYQGATQEAKPICLVEKSMGLIVKNQPIQASPDGTFRLPRGELRGNRIRYLLGWAAKDMRYPVLEPWAEKTIP